MISILVSNVFSLTFSFLFPIHFIEVVSTKVKETTTTNPDITLLYKEDNIVKMELLAGKLCQQGISKIFICHLMKEI